MQSSALQASADYDSALKRRLSQRVARLFRLSGIAIWLLSTLLTTHPALLLGDQGWLGFFTQLFVVKPAWSLIATIGLVPVVILRKRNLARPFPQPAASRISDLALLLDAQTYYMLLSFLLSWIALFVVWWHLASVSAPEPNLQIFIPLKLASNPKAANLVQFNPRFAYLLVSTFAFALSYAARFITKREATITFGFDTDQASFLHRTTGAFRTRYIQNSLPYILTHNFGLPVVWLLLRRPLLRALIYHTPFRHYFAAIYRHTSISSTLLLRSTACTAFMAATWDLANVLFDVYCTQAAPLSQYSTTPNASLVNGLQASDNVRKHLAYLELAGIAKNDQQRRKAIFKDISSQPNAFQAICDTTTRQLDISRQTIQSRGQPARQIAPPAQQTAPQKSSFPPIPVKRDNIVKPARPTFLDRFAATKADPSPSSQSSGHVTSQSVNPAQSTPQQKITSQVPSVFLSQSPRSSAPSGTSTNNQGVSSQSSQSSQPLVPAVNSSKISAYIQASLDSGFQKLLPNRIKQSRQYKWLYQSLPEGRIRRSCPNPAVDFWAIEALSNLLCCSLHDDPYGTAQKELPRVMEAFLGYSDALDTFVKESVQNDADGLAKEALSKQLQPLLSGVQHNTAKVLKAFKPYMSELKISPTLLDRLRPYIEWSQ